MKRVLVVALISLIPSVVNAENKDETTGVLVGSWNCVSGDCPDEEVEFAVEGGKNIYRSWLHHRPSVSDGSWKISEKNLTIESYGSAEQWKVVTLDQKKLVLKRADSSETATFRRLAGNK